LRVLHVTDADLPGRHFNGYDLLRDLAPRQIHGKLAVLRKESKDPRVVSLFSDYTDSALFDHLKAIERRNSINNLLVPWGRLLAKTREFAEADLVHYHLIHNGVVSLFDLEWLFGLKPSVWTFHDPWPLTGHCIHPMQSDGWLTGCSPCPYLDRMFAIDEDRADRMWKVKQRIYSRIDVDVVVASSWMLDMVRRSPLTALFENVHLIPFGIDVRSFLPDSERQASRRQLGIPADDFVVLVRANSWDAKGTSYAVRALAARAPIRPTTVLTIDQRGLVTELSEYRIVEMGWINDDELYARVFNACDVLLMPSLAETFGLMAVEAMAAGRPVVCFEGTALPGTTHAPECGIAVPAGDSIALRAALDRLAADPTERGVRGKLGREIAVREYPQALYLDSMADLYRSALARHRLRPRGHQTRHAS
jgi:glycosyltransferase involved in cell wall biosynthesis